MEELSELAKTVDKINDVYSYMFKDTETNDEKAQVARILEKYKPEGAKMEDFNINKVRNKECDTQEEAKAIIERVNSELDPVEFCPLRNNICRKDCVCFHPATFVPCQSKYYIRGFSCDNRMFSGE